MYHILPYSYNKARQLNVNIYPSKKPGKKIDVYKNNNYSSFPEWAFPKYSLLKNIFFKVPLLFFYSLKANKTN